MLDVFYKVGSVIIPFVGFVVAYLQLKKIQNQIDISLDNQKLDRLKVVLEIENQINTRKSEFDKTNKLIQESSIDKNLEVLQNYFNTTKENYLNALDRLCYCIDKNYIDERDWKSEYRNMLRDTIETFPDDFNEASPYRNIKKINNKWQRE